MRLGRAHANPCEGMRESPGSHTTRLLGQAASPVMGRHSPECRGSRFGTPHPKFEANRLQRFWSGINTPQFFISDDAARKCKLIEVFDGQMMIGYRLCEPPSKRAMKTASTTPAGLNRLRSFSLLERLGCCASGLMSRQHRRHLFSIAKTTSPILIVWYERRMPNYTGGRACSQTASMVPSETPSS